MILSFSGDPFLARRAARRAIEEQGLTRSEVVELGEGMDAAAVAQQGAQGGLFGRVALLLDLDAAFTGQAGVKPRNEVLAVLGEIPAASLVLVIDAAATGPRQKRYRELGRHQHLPTPRFGGLQAWLRDELKSAGLRFERDVPDTLVDLFGDDLPGMLGEIAKLQALGEDLDAELVRRIAGRRATRNAFDLIEATVSGNAGTALGICETLGAQGEAPARVLGALAWQYEVVARCVALRESRGPLAVGEAAAALGVKPYVAGKALAIAARLDEDALRRALAAILRADRAIKGGRGEEWGLEALALELSALFEPVASS